jgi:hypothetical protein
MAKTHPILSKLFALFIAVVLTIAIVSCKRQPSNNNTDDNNSTSANQPQESIHIIMANVAENFSVIYRKINTPGSLSDSDRKAISDDLHNMRDLFARADAVFKHKSDIYQIGYAFVTRYINFSLELMREPDRNIARSHLFALHEICSSCHTQDDKSAAVRGI